MPFKVNSFTLGACLCHMFNQYHNKFDRALWLNDIHFFSSLFIIRIQIKCLYYSLKCLLVYCLICSFIPATQITAGSSLISSSKFSPFCGSVFKNVSSYSETESSFREDNNSSFSSI